MRTCSTTPSRPAWPELLVFLIPDSGLLHLGGPRRDCCAPRRRVCPLVALEMFTPGPDEDQNEADRDGEPPLQRVGQVRSLAGVRPGQRLGVLDVLAWRSRFGAPDQVCAVQRGSRPV